MHRISEYCLKGPVVDPRQKKQSCLEHLTRKAVVLSATVDKSAQYIAQSIALHEETLPRLLLPPDSIRGGSTVAVASNRPNGVKFA